MADPNERNDIFDQTLDAISNVAARKPIRAAHYNKLVDAANKGRKGVGSPEQIAASVSVASSVDFGVIRGWPDPTGDLLDVSMISRDEDAGSWFIATNATVEIVCSPGLRADDYESVQWIGGGNEIYPLTLPSQIAVLAQPIVSVGADLVAMWLPSIAPAQDIPDNLPTTDGSNKNGTGEVGFVINL